MQQTDEPVHATDAPRPGLIAGAKAFGAALKAVFGAQFGLLKAEWALARSALAWMFVAGLAATVAGVGCALTALALIGLLLATWWGSWLWALLALAGVQLILLGAAIVMFRRCMHWLSLPLTREQWTGLVRLSEPADDAAHADERAVKHPVGERA
ncbi:MAG: ABC transporter ATP-binding protein [Rhodanobacter sp.]